MLTPEQIAEQTDHLYGIANKRAINDLFRHQDTSYLWPIRNKFNVTERAIRQARKIDIQCYGLEYCYLLNQLISSIVNDPKNS